MVRHVEARLLQRFFNVSAPLGRPLAAGRSKRAFFCALFRGNLRRSNTGYVGVILRKDKLLLRAGLRPYQNGKVWSLLHDVGPSPKHVFFGFLPIDWKFRLEGLAAQLRAEQQWSLRVLHRIRAVLCSDFSCSSTRSPATSAAVPARISRPQELEGVAHKTYRVQTQSWLAEKDLHI